MYYKMTIRIPKESFLQLKQESEKLGFPMAELIRGWLEIYPLNQSSIFPNQDSQNLNVSKIQEAVDSLRPLLLENNLLLRKIARYTNSQIVMETDAQLPQLLKKERV